MKLEYVPFAFLLQNSFLAGESGDEVLHNFLQLRIDFFADLTFFGNGLENSSMLAPGKKFHTFHVTTFLFLTIYY